MSYLKSWSNEPVPQSEPLPGQVANNAGGNSWKVDRWAQLGRFLVLGSEGGTYYVNQRNLTQMNVSSLEDCLNDDPIRVIDMIVTISTGGRAPSNNEAIYALAVAASHRDLAVRNYALSKLSAVCRTATMLFDFLTFAQGQRGWGRNFRRHISNWYTQKDPDKLAYQLVKYRQRNGWTHRDVLRKAHPKTSNGQLNKIFGWVTNPDNTDFRDWPDAEATNMIAAYEYAKHEDSDLNDVIRLVSEYNIPREAIPTEYLKEPALWKTMLNNRMPMTAMIRNLRNMENYGVFKTQAFVDMVCDALENEQALEYARIHPIAIMKAMYSFDGNRAIKDSLEKAFYKAFKFVEPTNKRWSLNLDVSGSMTMGNIGGIEGFTPRVAASAMAMVTARTERHYKIKAFSDGIIPVNISGNDSLSDVIQKTRRLSFSSTDCALPMMDALEKREEYDVFVIYTDSETWYGSIHPAEALRKYNRTMGLNAKLIVVGMVSNNFSIADPNDVNMLDVIGFSNDVPQVMSGFVLQ